MKKSIGIVGFGAVTRLYHLPYILSNNNLDLILIVDPIASQNSNLADEFNLSKNLKIIKDLDYCLKDNEIPEIFVVATPPNTHYNVLLKLITYNKIILVEKPFLLNINELDHINQQIKLTNGKLYVNQMRRFLPTLNFIKEIVENGLYGNLSKVKVFEGYKSAWKTISNYNALSQKFGGGNLIDTGIHIIDSIIYMTNIKDYEIVNYEDDSTDEIPDSEFKLNLKSENHKIDINIYSTRNSNLTPYYEFTFDKIMVYFYLNNHNLVYFNTPNYKNIKIEVGPTFTYEDSFAAVYKEILDDTNNNNSRISNYSNTQSVQILDKIINRNKTNNNSYIGKFNTQRKKILLFGGNSYVAKQFIKYVIENNYTIDVVSRSPVILNNNSYDNYINNISWNDATTMLYNVAYDFSINFAYDTTLTKKSNIQLIKNISRIINLCKIPKNFHLSSIAIYNSAGDVKSFNLFTKYSYKYSYIKKITDFEYQRRIKNSIILRCGNFVGIDSPLWLNSFINFIIERKYFPLMCNNNSNILLTDDFSEFIINFDTNERVIDLVSKPITWKAYINDLSKLLNVEIYYSNLHSNLSFVSNIKDLLFLFSNNPIILGYLKNSKIVEILKNFNTVKKLFLSFRKLEKKNVNSNAKILYNSSSNSIDIQSRWIDTSVKNVINLNLSFNSPIKSKKDNYIFLLNNLKNKLSNDKQN
jgi:predicted dehydrogenase